MESVEVNGYEYVAVAEKEKGSCLGCIAFEASESLCDSICDLQLSTCLGSKVIWVPKETLKKQAELNQFFGRTMTEQIEMFPETLAVTQEEEEAWVTQQKSVARGVTDGSKQHKQVGGEHYFNAIQPWDIIRAWDLNYWEGNVIKYVLRHKGKNKTEDLAKAVHYLEHLIENYDELYPVSK